MLGTKFAEKNDYYFSDEDSFATSDSSRPKSTVYGEKMRNYRTLLVIAPVTATEADITRVFEMFGELQHIYARIKHQHEDQSNKKGQTEQTYLMKLIHQIELSVTSNYFKFLEFVVRFAKIFDAFRAMESLDGAHLNKFDSEIISVRTHDCLKNFNTFKVFCHLSKNITQFELGNIFSVKSYFRFFVF